MTPTAIIKFRGEHSFLSNFHLAPINWEGHRFPTAEHAFQYAKAIYANAPKVAEQIAQVGSPADAKRLGKPLNTVLSHSYWNVDKIDTMKHILQVKFNPDDRASLHQKLWETGNAPLIEGNYWHDNFWGVCWCDHCPGDGVNHLGFLLMEIRGNRP